VRLVVDASALVAEALRERGQRLIADPRLELAIAEPMWSEVVHEIGRRLSEMERHGRVVAGMSAVMQARTLALVARQVIRLAAVTYVDFEAAARKRIPRDPSDWPTVAAAMQLDAAIWTRDYDFFGCGIAVWTTETLLAHLEG
jgi:predicted nucleic acid-binding protein